MNVLGQQSHVAGMCADLIDASAGDEQIRSKWEKHVGVRIALPVPLARDELHEHGPCRARKMSKAHAARARRERPMPLARPSVKGESAQGLRRWSRLRRNPLHPRRRFWAVR